MPRDETQRLHRRPSAGGPGLSFLIRLWMLVGGMIPLVALFLFGYLTARSAMIEASQEHLIDIVESRRSQIETWLTERMTDLRVIGGSRDCIRLVEEAASHPHHEDVCRYLQSFQTGTRDYRAIELYDLGWNRVAANTSSMMRLDGIAEPETKRILSDSDGPVLVSIEPREGAAGDLQMANRLRPMDHDPIGYVVASLDLERTLAPILEDRAGLGRTGRVLVADLSDSGRILHPPDPAIEAPPRFVSHELLEEVRRAGLGTARYRDETGEMVFAGFTLIEEQGWLVVAEITEEEALSLLHSLQRGFLIAALLTILGVILFSARISRRLSAPLAALASAARRIKEGGRHERVPVLAGREVGELGRSFNEMLDALEETRRLQVQASTLAAVGEISSGVVHEIRNRLSSVKMNLQALDRHVRHDPTFAELSEIALRQVLRIERLLNDLLNYARPVELTLQTARIGSLLQETAEGLRAAAEAKGVALEIRAEVDDPILVDRERLEEAYANLVRNAIEVTAPGGRVVLRARPAPAAEEAIHLEVEDAGPGIGGTPPEELFRPFVTTKEEGTGLGLAYAKKIVELHEGTITAENRPGGGALFRLELPKKGVPR
ncbi:MAG: HAMP domain-containing protein [Candidatus Eisenbacteria bacterium]|nr:HAMP domain-containing protein [Candidatus Latescibacterota bacterium]MBD3303355.1 HAMP domain-containing protein [Candidatus Eisenbacteria bacterium]